MMRNTASISERHWIELRFERVRFRASGRFLIRLPPSPVRTCLLTLGLKTWELFESWTCFLPHGRIDNVRLSQAEQAWHRIPACLDSRGHFTLASGSRILPAARISGYGTATVTRKKVAGMEVVFMPGLLFWLLNRTSSSFCRSPALPFFSAASNAFMVGP